MRGAVFSLVGWLALGLAGCAGEQQEVKTAAPVTEVQVESPTEVPVETPPPPKAEPVPSRPLQTPKPLELVVFPNPHNPIVSFRLVFRAGSSDDPPGQEGVTALAATVMTEGGTRTLSSSELLAALFPMAAELTVHTDAELTTFSGRVHKDHLERFLKIFTDALLEPRFDSKEFDRLRQDALSAVKNDLRGENDEALGKAGLRALVYEGHPYAHWEGGTVAALQALTLDNVKAQASRVFTQDRLVVGLAGPVDGALQKKLIERLSKLPATGAPLAALPAPPGHRQRAWILQKDAASTALSIGYAYPLRRDDPDFYKVAFALSYLGEHRQFNGVLYTELREKRGLNYGDYAYAEHFVQDSEGVFPLPNVAWSEQLFSIWVRPVEPQNALFAARGAIYFLEQLVKEGIPQDAFENTRGFLTGYTRLWEQTDQRRLGYAIDSLYYGTPDFLEGYRKAMASMTRQDVNAAIGRHLSVDTLNFVFVAKDADALAKALRAPSPSPITYPTPKPLDVLELDKALAAQRLPIHPELVEVHPVAGFMER